jgi:hypothetical protein
MLLMQLLKHKSALKHVQDKSATGVQQGTEDDYQKN